MFLWTSLLPKKEKKEYQKKLTLPLAFCLSRPSTPQVHSENAQSTAGILPILLPRSRGPLGWIPQFYIKGNKNIYKPANVC